MRYAKFFKIAFKVLLVFVLFVCMMALGSGHKVPATTYIGYAVISIVFAFLIIVFRNLERKGK